MHHEWLGFSACLLMIAACICWRIAAVVFFSACMCWFGISCDIGVFVDLVDYLADCWLLSVYCWKMVLIWLHFFDHTLLLIKCYLFIIDNFWAIYQLWRIIDCCLFSVEIWKLHDDCWSGSADLFCLIFSDNALDGILLMFIHLLADCWFYIINYK